MRACPQFCGVVYAGAHRLVVFGRDGYASDFAIIAGAFEGRELHHMFFFCISGKICRLYVLYVYIYMRMVTQHVHSLAPKVILTTTPPTHKR